MTIHSLEGLKKQYWYRKCGFGSSNAQPPNLWLLQAQVCLDIISRWGNKFWANDSLNPFLELRNVQVVAFGDATKNLIVTKISWKSNSNLWRFNILTICLFSKILFSTVYLTPVWPQPRIETRYRDIIRQDEMNHKRSTTSVVMGAAYWVLRNKCFIMIIF